MLRSGLIGGSADLISVANGVRQIREPEQSDAVERIQQALICVGFELPDAGVDGVFGRETGRAVSAFKTDRQLGFTDPVVGVGTTKRLDLEVAYLEGVTDPSDDEALRDDRIVVTDPFFGDVIGLSRPDLQIPDRILRFFELSDEFCFPLAPMFGPLVASTFGRLVEPRFRDDYCTLQAPCSGNDFFDLPRPPRPYPDFLRDHNPSVPGPVIDQVGGSMRPDILRHRTDQPEWYEIKPLTPSGVAEFLVKGKVLRANYALGFLYVEGRIYRPSRQIHLATLVTAPPDVMQRVLHRGCPASPGHDPLPHLRPR